MRDKIIVYFTPDQGLKHSLNNIISSDLLHTNSDESNFSSQLLYTLCDETYLKNSRFYAILSAEKHAAGLVTPWQGLHKRGCISKRISKKFLEIFLEIGIPYGVRDFSRFEQKRAENPCKHWGFSFFYRLLSSRKIRQFPMGYCALKTVWAHAHKGSNPFPSAKVAAMPARGLVLTSPLY